MGGRMEAHGRAHGRAHGGRMGGAADDWSGRKEGEDKAGWLRHFVLGPTLYLVDRDLIISFFVFVHVRGETLGRHE